MHRAIFPSVPVEGRARRLSSRATTELRRLHALGELRLREPGVRSRLDQHPRQLELRPKRIIPGPAAIARADRVRR